jgi:hypothetical protein
VTELMERVQREDREWREARLHYAMHGNWLDRDECNVCQGIVYPDSPYLHLTPWARGHLDVAEYERIAIRAESLNARVGAFYGARTHQWKCSATTPERRVSLRGAGPLGAVLTGLLDDLEELL